MSFVQDEERNLVFSVKDVVDGKTKDFRFTFKKTAESRNGFVVYSYDKEVLDFFGNQSNDNDNKENNSDKDLDCVFLSCYHYAKSLYHEHEVHDESDARIKAYYFKTEGDKRVYLSEEPDILALNHEVIDFFLGQYEQLFCRYYAESISKSYKDFMWYIQQLREKPNEILYDKLKGIPTDSKLIDLALLWFQNKKKDIDKLLELSNDKNEEEAIQGHTKSDNSLSDTKKLKEITQLSDYIKQNRARVLVALLGKVLKLCGNALTEYTYCKTLLESKYNSYTHHDVVFTEDEIRDLSGNNCDPTLIKRDLRRKRAFNIRNSIRYIEGIRNKCNIWENDLLQDVMNQNQKMLQISNEVNKSNEDMLVSSKKSNVISIVLGAVSVALGVLSIVLAVDSSRKPSNLQEKTQKIEQTIKGTSTPPIPSFPETEYQWSPKE